MISHSQSPPGLKSLLLTATSDAGVYIKVKNVNSLMNFESLFMSAVSRVMIPFSTLACSVNALNMVPLASIAVLVRIWTS